MKTRINLTTILYSLLFVVSGFAFAQESTAPAPPPEIVNYGWVQDEPKADDLAKSVSKYSGQLKTLALYNDDQSDAFNYRYLFQALRDAGQLTPAELQSGRLSALNQQDVGSCVGYSTTQSLDILMATDIYLRHEREDWVQRMNPDAIYGIGRLKNLGKWDGSSGSWSVDGISKVGTLHRLLYGENSEFDLRQLNPKQGRKWASTGIDKALLKYAIDHKAIACTRIETVEEAKAALQNGYPLIVCAQASYSLQRNDKGFSKRTGKAWSHAMAVIAYRSPASGAEGYLIWNSWGDNWNSGGYFPEDMPHGSFWVTPTDLRFHIDQEDTWAIAGYEGFKSKSLDWSDVF